MLFRSKTLIVLAYLLIPLIYVLRVDSLTVDSLVALTPTIAQQWFFLTVGVVLGHVLYLLWTHNFRSSMIWFVKLATDPFTDIVAYYDSPYRLVLASQGRKSTTA